MFLSCLLRKLWRNSQIWQPCYTLKSKKLLSPRWWQTINWPIMLTQVFRDPIKNFKIFQSFLRTFQNGAGQKIAWIIQNYGWGISEGFWTWAILPFFLWRDFKFITKSLDHFKNTQMAQVRVMILEHQRASVIGATKWAGALLPIRKTTSSQKKAFQTFRNGCLEVDDLMCWA